MADCTSGPVEECPVCSAGIAAHALTEREHRMSPEEKTRMRDDIWRKMREIQSDMEQLLAINSARETR